MAVFDITDSLDCYFHSSERVKPLTMAKSGNNFHKSRYTYLIIPSIETWIYLCRNIYAYTKHKMDRKTL